MQIYTYISTHTVLGNTGNVCVAINTTLGYEASILDTYTATNTHTQTHKGFCTYTYANASTYTEWISITDKYVGMYVCTYVRMYTNHPKHLPC